MKKISAFLMAAWLAAAGGMSHAADEIRIGWVYAMANAPALVADNNGYFKEQGLDAKLLSFTSGPLLKQAMVAGEIDLAYIGSPPVYHWFSRGLKSKILAKVNYGQAAVERGHDRRHHRAPVRGSSKSCGPPTSTIRKATCSCLMSGDGAASSTGITQYWSGSSRSGRRRGAFPVTLRGDDAPRIQARRLGERRRAPRKVRGRRARHCGVRHQGRGAPASWPMLWTAPRWERRCGRVIPSPPPGSASPGSPRAPGHVQGDEFEHSGPARIRYRFLGDRGFDVIVAVDHTGVIHRRNLQEEAGFSERRVRINWGGARILPCVRGT